MTCKIAILAAVGALAAGPALAQTNWTDVATGPSGTLSYDATSVTQSNGVVTATIKVAGATSTSLNATLPSGQVIHPAYYVERMSIACAASTYADLQMTSYDAQNNVLGSQANVHGMIPVAQSSVAQAMQAKLCQ